MKADIILCQIKDAYVALIDDEKILRRYCEDLEKHGIATLPLRSILEDIEQIKKILKAIEELKK